MKRLALLILLALALSVRLQAPCLPDTESHMFAGYGTHGQCTYFDMTDSERPIVEELPNE